MAKELCIHAENLDIYTGTALRDLSQSGYEGCVFPLVRTFTLLLESYADEDSSEVDDDSDESKESVDVDDVYQANVGALVLWIKQMAPMVNRVEVKLGDSFGSDNSCDRHFTNLVSRLYQFGNRVRYSCKNRRGVPVELGLDEIRDLVHINFRDEYDSGQFSHLARRNAQTLQSFYLQSPRFKDLANLIQNPDGSYVLGSNTHLATTYFSGGNSATLESLVLQADSFIVSMIRQYGVFTSTSHPKLQCVIFRHLARLVSDTFATYAEGVQYALSIGPGAVVRKIGVPSSDELLPGSLITW
ncbi:hypothetical protein GGH93_001826 [Coemansia aciculifera]|nr:hypothetical protein GGH93_001826 [Coemansia aciculifera]